jgi:PBP1b-binding outer membrane lipoprotein LpoB
MKKVILALAIVSVAFVACNNEGESKEAKTDSPAVETPKVDTPAVVPAVVDSAAKAVVDSMKK